MSTEQAVDEMKEKHRERENWENNSINYKMNEITHIAK